MSPLNTILARGIIVAVGALALAAPAHASVFRDWLHGVERHDDLYVRGHVGLGYANLATTGGDGVDMDGIALALSLEIGDMVGSEVGLHLAGWGTILTSPNVDNFFRGTVQGAASCAVFGIGPGVLLYLGNTDLWWSLATGVSVGAVESPRVSDVFGTHASRSDGLGFAFHGAVGKDFWIGDEVQLGLALELGLAGVPLAHSSDDAMLMSFALSANLTFD